MWRILAMNQVLRCLEEFSQRTADGSRLFDGVPMAALLDDVNACIGQIGSETLAVRDRADRVVGTRDEQDRRPDGTHVGSDGRRHRLARTGVALDRLTR